MSTLLKPSQKNLVQDIESVDDGVNSIVNSLNLGSGEQLPHLDIMSKAAMKTVFHSDTDEEIEAMRRSPTSALKSRVTMNGEIVAEHQADAVTGFHTADAKKQ